MSEQIELKYTSFSGRFGDRNPRNKAVYAIIGNRIIFAGFDDGSKGSRLETHDCEEQVVGAIVKNENIEGREYEFFDLQPDDGFVNSNRRTDNYQLIRLELHWMANCRQPTYVGQKVVPARDHIELLRAFDCFIEAGDGSVEEYKAYVAPPPAPAPINNPLAATLEAMYRGRNSGHSQASLSTFA